jgi:hypothetical protein
MEIDPDCTCPCGERSYGALNGIPMGWGTVRLSTAPGCPVHDTCQRYTAENRSLYPNGRWLYCPLHGTTSCPPRSASEPMTPVSVFR